MGARQQWADQWDVAMHAPLPFMACVLAAIVVIWLFANWAYRREISQLKQEVASAKQQAATADQHTSFYKDKIPELEKTIDVLNKKIGSGASRDQLQAISASAQETVRVLSGGWVAGSGINAPGQQRISSSGLDRILQQIEDHEKGRKP